MAVRKFWLENSLGDIYEMTDSQYNHFFANPSNLGFAKNYSYVRLGNADVITSQQYQLMTVQGEMLLYGDTTDEMYEMYSEFIRFIRHVPLKLHYRPANMLYDYYSDIIITQLDKGEVNADDSIMHCPVYFKCNTHWLTTDEKAIVVTNEAIGEGKKYPLVRPYAYAGTTFSNIVVNNNGFDEVGFMWEVIGKVTNPQLTVSMNGARYGICKLNGTFDYVKVNSVDAEEEIYLENNGAVIANAVAYQDLSVADGESYVTFIKMKSGQSTFVFSYSGEFNGEVKIRWRDSYVSV